MSRTMILVGAALVALAGCDRKSSNGLPPAKDWQAPAVRTDLGPAPGTGTPMAPGGPGGPAMGGTDPHAGVPGAPPLGGGAGGGDPHAGVPGAPPLGGGAGGADPHAGVPGAPPLGDGTGGADPHGGGAAPSGVDVSAMGLPPPDHSRPIDPGKYLEGTIALAPSYQGKVPAGGAIFISVRPIAPGSDQPSGAPIAVDKLSAGSSWPLAFRLTEAQAMIGGTGFTGDVLITARYDQDQDALSKQGGDIAGQVRATIPAKGLTLILDTML